MNIDELKSHALAARREIVTMIYESGNWSSGRGVIDNRHSNLALLPGSRSGRLPRSRVVMSKGHAVAAQYAMLYQKGRSIVASSLRSGRSTRACRAPEH